MELNRFSDHCPISLSIDVSISHLLSVASDKFKRAPRRYRWDHNKDSQKFKENLSSDSCMNNTLDKLINKRCQNKDDVNEINELLIQLLRAAADMLPSNKQSVKAKRKSNAKEPWYDDELALLKRKINRHSRWLCKNPENSVLRESLFLTKKEYKRSARKKKNMFIETINKKIEDGRSISWDCFKELKGRESSRQELDFYDMISFIQFFQQLYSSSNIEKDKIATFQVKNDIKIDAENMLNREIDMEELKSCIKKLKTGKAPAEDQVLNEFAKSANNEVLTAYLKVFNECLNHGHYPWNTAVVTPIHKKGDIYDPNNYIAIAVGSCIGKLFSSILLERLHKFRAENAPNPSNHWDSVQRLTPSTIY